MDSRVPLNYEASAGETNVQTTATLPQEVVQCLENARFLHLATCTDNVPNVSLMNYTYLPSSTFSANPVIVMTTNPASRKTHNLLSNPNVSLLVHDWSSHRPPTTGRRPSGGSPGPEHRSSLASLLLNLNTAAVSSISATINGTARLVDNGSDEEKFYRTAHLENNTFDEPGGAQQQTFDPTNMQAEDGGRGCFVAGEAVRVIVVKIRDIRISDWKGTVRDYVLTDATPQVNGVR
ncbi:Pyridoxamine 5'-phosphate oxidase-like protein [Colletotrichum spinosum]|uniref:Pyridoxamine 5'-phosphate oxidase-like protein n=1 Tax=Colletotrichum spinosum TaxID=1347390 RepID=A0A4V3HQY9_9PEZI|nr:Pyridoxamine 5'-phosphate oxidase-like protein [Colletotrichum spinosum]